MSTRKKASKKSSAHSAKAIKRSPKSSATNKAKDAKVSAKINKPARSAKKVAAKTTKTAKVSSRKTAAKAKAAHAKSSRVASAAKSAVKAAAKTTKKKSASAPKLQHAKGASKTNVRSTASQSKERVIASAAKKKSENEKKGQERLSATVHAKTVQSKIPAAPSKTPAAGDSRTHASAPAKAVHPPAAVIGLESAALRPVKASAMEKPAAAISEEAVVQKPAKSGAPRHGFKTNEFIVYPAHGVGQIVALEEQEVAGFKLELFVITFVKDKMTLRVPTGKVAGVGMRKLAEPDVVKKALDILLGRARIKRTMWSRRAQEYETKINSGDLAAISEVVRDLYRSEAQPEQSYSERQLYEAALDRMAREVAVVQKLTEGEALKAIDAQLQKGQRRGAKIESDAAAPGAGDSDVEEAA
jgi:CarD family transcriptional regulator